MSSFVYAEGTLERIRRLVATVQEQDLSACAPEQALELDSTTRISLLVELENEFGIEFGDDDVSPEMFESLASLAATVEARTA